MSEKIFTGNGRNESDRERNLALIVSGCSNSCDGKLHLAKKLGSMRDSLLLQLQGNSDGPLIIEGFPTCFFIPLQCM